MYKAKIEIGGYKVGDEVPEEKALVWQKMYKESPVEQVQSAYEGEKPLVPKEEADDAPEVGNEMHDDYINRNTDVVKKAIEKDNLDKSTLENLLKIEVSNKGRRKVIEAIKIKMKTLN